MDLQKVRITLFILSCGLPMLLSNSAKAFSRMDRVPEEFPSLQEAVDSGTAPVIRVTTGKYHGAVLNRPVKLICVGTCEITTGILITPNLSAGLVVEEGASGSSIVGFDFVAVDLGIISSCVSAGTAADDVTVAQNNFFDTSQGVTVTGSDCDTGNNWKIIHNTFLDIRSDISNCGGGLGIYLVEASGAKILHNRFRGTLSEPPCGSIFITAGISLSGCSDSLIKSNDFELADGGQLYKFDIALLPEFGPNLRTSVIHNDFRNSDAPVQGINLISLDNIDLTARCNFGTTSISHQNTDGVESLYKERYCYREVIETE